MNREDIMRMAQKVWSAGYVHERSLERFAALVAAHVKASDGAVTNEGAKVDVQPVAWLHVGGVYGEEPDEWELEAEQVLCDELNEKHINKPTALPLYPHPPAADVAELVEALKWIEKRCNEGLFEDGVLHQEHWKAAHDAGACARAYLKKWEGK